MSCWNKKKIMQKSNKFNKLPVKAISGKIKRSISFGLYLIQKKKRKKKKRVRSTCSHLDLISKFTFLIIGLQCSYFLLHRTIWD